ncbi:glycosyltransferase family 4 protein [Cytobacillus oceanisediminis]|uniref:glycosyltransferase family 4 protein n=1 Tax=Cytobacillus oceanisediminis TaxID=665099 RepID=UPI00203B7AEF|nr:glycosyltransferase family 4 protein [Cytobacillus oceanisediminis]MCM3244941.1 glycosyltransferase family 4 protein [Cytobacillus oceanisediminis]
MKKVAVIGHDLKFINHITQYMENVLGYEIRFDEWTGHEAHDERKSLEIIDWAEILFCEWGLGNVIWYQKHKKDHQKLFVRLHRFEMNTKYPSLFDYRKIDKLIAISPYIYEEFHRVAKVPRDKMTVVYNAVDSERFDKPKLNENIKFNLGIIGIVPKLKRLDQAVEIFEFLYEKDNRYKLYIKGKHPKEFGWVWNNPTEREYYDAVFKRIETSSFKKNIFFEGWGDVSEWLRNIGFVLSVSDYESFHMAPIEGMASGSYPVVLTREGVNTVFPKEYILSNKEEAADFILSDNKVETNSLKTFVRDSYSLEIIGKQLQGLFENTLKDESSWLQ